MDDSIAIKTDLFEHREMKPNFINPCCFGEDFARWLAQKLAFLGEVGFAFSEPIQEDYGWGLWASRGQDRFWIGLSYVGDGPQEDPAEWVVSVSRPRLIRKLLRRANSQRVYADLRSRILDLLKTEIAIQVLETPRLAR